MSKFLNFFYIKFPVFITSGSRLTSYLILDQDQINELTSQIGGVGGAGIYCTTFLRAALELCVAGRFVWALVVIYFSRE